MLSSGLPIDEALPALRRALAEHSSAVLTAPPGAGKSTVVPLALLGESWAAGKGLLMLEPRRVAARAVAQRMAGRLNEPVGRTVGCRMRRDTRVSRDTRIEVVTEGVLTRMLQTDPALKGVSAVLFDEYHERSLQADLGLALALDARRNLRPDLRILVMSATLETGGISRLLDDAPVVSAQGRVFPVETHFSGKRLPALPDAQARREDGPESLVTRLIVRALGEQDGDVLVFLPGAREIRRVGSLLSVAGVDARARILPLYGDLPAECQDAALAPVPGARRIVLATNIAETSLTIEGVRVVVDSGLVRRLRFDPATGMSRLEVRRISRASAEQRQGRAGRLGPGVCYRAWSEGSHRTLAPFTPAEILEADLAPLALELAQWGVREADELRWLDPPPAAPLAGARDLLRKLGALDGDGRISAHGRQMACLGVHPRLAHMLLRARSLGALPLAADLAALLSERDLLRGQAAGRDADIRSRLELLRGEARSVAEPDEASRDARGGQGGAMTRGANRFAIQGVRRTARDLFCQLTAGAAPVVSAGVSAGPVVSEGALLALAFPDRIGRRRSGSEGRFMLSNGRGGYFPEPQSLSRQELVVAVSLEDRAPDACIVLAAPLGREELGEVLPERLEWRQRVQWSRREQAVLARQELRLDELVLEERALAEVPAKLALRAMLEGLRELGIGALPWTRQGRDLQARVAFVRRLGAAYEHWPDLSDGALLASLDEWLAPWLDGLTRRGHLERIPLEEALLARLSWRQRRELDALAPSHLTVPAGSRIHIDYLDEGAPAVSVRLQEVFGLEATPKLGGGRVPVTFKLLSPAHRPVQVTRDLGGFWRGSYSEVRKDLRGRYPKHYWPEDPLEAQPVRSVRRRP